MNNKEKLDEFQLFKSILTYSIDNSNHESNKSLEIIGLNSEVFFGSDLYCKRLKTEQHIKTLIDSSDGLIKIFGNPGTGKTTVISKVLSTYKINSIVHKVDFKKIIEVEKEKFHDINTLISYVEKSVKDFLIGKCSNAGISRTLILDFFLETKNEKCKSHILKNGQFNDLRSEILDQYYRHNIDKSKTFKDWRKTWEPGGFFDELWSKLYRSLLAENLAYYIKNSENRIENIAVFYDNIDSIFDDRIRDNFCNAVKKIQSKSSDSIITLVSLRTNNPSAQELKDNGTFKTEPVYLNYKEFLRKDFLKEIEKKYPNRKLTGKEEYFLYKKHYSIQNEIFANNILKARINFLKSKLPIISKKYDLDISLIEKLEELFFSLLDDKRLGPASSDLSNYDRREGIELLVEFSKYLLNNNVDLADPAYDKMVLESHFYFWIGENNIIFDDSLKDIFEVFQDWEKDSANIFGCSTDHLLLSLIANETDPSSENYEFEYSVKTKVSAIVNKLESIGIEENDVKKIILRLYKKKDQKLGLIELSEFYGIDSVKHINSEFEIWLTPRGINYNMFSSLKFSYLLSILCKHEKKNIKYFWPNDPLNKAAFELVIKFLQDVAIMHISGLLKIKEQVSYCKPNNQDDYWLKFFVMNFCNITSVRKKYKYYLNFSNIIRSHQAFIFKLINSNQEINDVDLMHYHGKYDILKSKFEVLVDKILENSQLPEDLESYFKII